MTSIISLRLHLTILNVYIISCLLFSFTHTHTHTRARVRLYKELRNGELVVIIFRETK